MAAGYDDRGFPDQGLEGSACGYVVDSDQGPGRFLAHALADHGVTWDQAPGTEGEGPWMVDRLRFAEERVRDSERERILDLIAGMRELYLERLAQRPENEGYLASLQGKIAFSGLLMRRLREGTDDEEDPSEAETRWEPLAEGRGAVVVDAATGEPVIAQMIRHASLARSEAPTSPGPRLAVPMDTGARLKRLEDFVAHLESVVSLLLGDLEMTVEKNGALVDRLEALEAGISLHKLHTGRTISAHGDRLETTVRHLAVAIDAIHGGNIQQAELKLARAAATRLKVESGMYGKAPEAGDHPTPGDPLWPGKEALHDAIKEAILEMYPMGSTHQEIRDHATANAELAGGGS